jgi:hypothetical protein
LGVGVGVGVGVGTSAPLASTKVLISSAKGPSTKGRMLSVKQYMASSTW